MTDQRFNWNWISSASATKKSSGVLKKTTSVISDFRQAFNGAISSSDLNSFATSVNQSVQRLRSEWNNYAQPIFDSLPAGGVDTRWSTTFGKGLQKEIDCFTYGIQGSTLFVFNDANSTKADGRYWDSDKLRPKTIAEKLEDLYQEISNISIVNSSATDTIDTDDLWAAIGIDYRDDESYLTDHGSLNTRVSLTETYFAQINNDLYDSTQYPTVGSLGNPLVYSFADVLDALLKLHNVDGWGSDPSAVFHGSMTVAAHTHEFDEVTPAPSISSTAGRTASHVNLEDEVLRLRYEIQAVKGSSNWYSDASYPTGVTGTATLHGHINKTGSGSPSDTNPHALTYIDLGIDIYLNNIVTFTGMSDLNDSTPSYSSTTYVTQGSSHTTAVGALDAALAAVAEGVVVRIDYGPYDRSALSVTERAQTPITITHNRGKKPIIQVIDNNPETSDYYGIYSSPTYDVEINYPDSNIVEIYTEAAIVEVIALF